MQNLSPVGLWDLWPRLADRTDSELAEFGAELEELGYGALWLGVAKADLHLAGPLLRDTQRLVFATGILNIWTEPPADVAAALRAARHPERILAGIGAGHRELNSERGFTKPYTAITEYLDQLDVPAGNLALAALGPKMLRLAADRTAGAHPYLVTPEHTASARETLGAGPLLAPEQKVVVETDPDTARSIARETVDRYLQMRNYRASLRRLGFTDDDFAGGGTDRLVDALVAWGTEEDIAARVRAHRDAGADHVAVQVLPAAGEDRMAGYRRLAPALTA